MLKTQMGVRPILSIYGDSRVRLFSSLFNRMALSPESRTRGALCRFRAVVVNLSFVYDDNPKILGSFKEVSQEDIKSKYPHLK